MAQFSWTDDLYTGNALMDGDHRELIGLVNALFKAMDDEQANEPMSAAMNDLIVYARAHFGREETEMTRIGYVASLAHHAEHAKLIQQLWGLKQMLESGGRINVPAVADFLSGWLRDHILTADFRLAAALKHLSSEAPALQPH